MNISYSIVLYNNSLEQVKKLFKNIFEMTPNEIEYDLYVVNNSASHGILVSLLNDIELSNKHVHIISPLKNVGFGAGHNLAIKEIRSDYHIIVNPDIEIPNDKQVRKMLQHMKKNNISLLSPLIKYPDGKIQMLVKRNPTFFDLLIRFLGTEIFPKRQAWFSYMSDGYKKEHKGSNFPGSFLIFSTSVLKQIGGFDERYFLYMEDADISRTMAKHGKAVFYPDAFVYHELQRDNRTTFRGVLEMSLSVVKYFNKWGWKFW